MNSLSPRLSFQELQGLLQQLMTASREGVTLDDFETGYSLLASSKRLPLSPHDFAKPFSQGGIVLPKAFTP
jgi:predicted signal transduction protein with EAL and GGDEF domain